MPSGLISPRTRASALADMGERSAFVAGQRVGRPRRARPRRRARLRRLLGSVLATMAITAAGGGDGHGRQDGAEQPAQAGAPAGPRAPRAAYALAGDERRALTHVGERRRPGSRRDETARHLLAEDPDLVLERHREV